jgi:hypothetical protein
MRTLVLVLVTESVEALCWRSRFFSGGRVVPALSVRCMRAVLLTLSDRD